MNGWKEIGDKWKDCIFFRTARDGIVFYLMIAILILVGVLLRK